MNRRNVLLSLFSLLLAFSACGRGDHVRRPEAPPPKAARPVHTAAVASSGGGEVTVPAAVAARRSATLAARIPAAVRALPKREGEAVAAGEVVVHLDDSALRAGLEAAQTGEQTAGADLARLQGLAQRSAATPREVEEAAARAAAARAAVSVARENLAYAVLRSPFAGVIASRRVEVGDVVSPGQPLLVIEGSGGLEIRATLSDEESRGLRPGAEIAARVDGVREPLRVRVTALSPAGDPATHRFELRADLPSAAATTADLGLRSGLFARLVLPASAAVGGEEPGALTVPASAVFQRGGLSGVFVAEPGDAGGGIARLRWIAVGAPAGDRGERIEVRAGCSAGERVVVDPPADLADGDPIVATAGDGEAR